MELTTKIGVAPNSPDIALIPLNPKGALELGLYPCHYCDVGWANHDGKNTTACYDDGNCEYFEYYKARCFEEDMEKYKKAWEALAEL